MNDHLGSDSVTPESHSEVDALLNAVAEGIYRDAERYRWFRKPGEAQQQISKLQENELDAAIDVELAKLTA